MEKWNFSSEELSYLLSTPDLEIEDLISKYLYATFSESDTENQ